MGMHPRWILADIPLANTQRTVDPIPIRVCFLIQAFYTHTDLQRIKEKVAEGAEPYITGWDRIKTDHRASLDYEPTPHAILRRTPDRESYDDFLHDIHAAQLHVISYVVTDDEEDTPSQDTPSGYAFQETPSPPGNAFAPVSKWLKLLGLYF